MIDRSKEELQKGGFGTLVLLVGPSGSGKDSLLDWARSALATDARILFVRRCITREAGDPTEDHVALSVAAFQKAEMDGEFVISWGAHGLYYGLPASLLDHLETGGVAIANGSRKTIPILKEQFPRLEVINLTVEPEILAQRLAGRGRETEAEIKERLERTRKLQGEDLFDENTINLDNSSELSVAGDKLVTLLKGWADRTDRAQSH